MFKAFRAFNAASEESFSRCFGGGAGGSVAELPPPMPHFPSELPQSQPRQRPPTSTPPPDSPAYHPAEVAVPWKKRQKLERISGSKPVTGSLRFLSLTPASFFGNPTVQAVKKVHLLLVAHFNSVF